MPESAALQGFVDKWLAREPEVRILETFCSAERRALLRAWGALANEIIATATTLSDPGVAAAKLGWWAQDLLAGTQGRHPLTRALYERPEASALPAGHWQHLLQAAQALAADPEVPVDPQRARERVEPVAQALAAIETVLWSAPVPADSWTLHLLLADFGRQPPPQPGRTEDSRGSAAWSAAVRELARHARPDRGAALPAAFRLLLDRQRLPRRPAPVPRVAGWRVLLCAWRAARLDARGRRG